MTSRLVSTTWNKAALAIFPKRPAKGQPRRHLNLNKLFMSPNFNPIPFLDPKLAKSVYFQDRISESEYNSTQTKFLRFFSQFSNQIEIMEIEIKPSFAPNFCSVIANNCPNLKALYFKINYG